MKSQVIRARVAIVVALCSLGSVLVLGTPAGAAYLRDVPQTLVQPNKVVIHCLASGDEYYNWVHDAQGYVIIQDPNTGYYTYAVQANGDLVSSKFIVGQVDPAAVGLEPNIKPSLAILKAKLEGRMMAVGGDAVGAAPTAGTINNIVVFIRFSGETEFGDTLATYDTMFNNSTAGANSMRNYYLEASYNALTIGTTFYPIPPGATVVSWQDAAHTRGYFQPFNAVTNPIGYTTGAQSAAREFKLLKDAVDGVSAAIPAGLNVDGDGDGNVDNVCFIIRGSPGAWADLLWPHHWELSGENAQINGKRVWDFNLQLQTSLASSGVGVLCHEMFHSMGAPDLYHYSNCSSDTGYSPAGRWDIMDNDVNPPQHMSAYMKFKYGKWIASIPVIAAPGRFTLNPLTSSTGNCFKIVSPNTANEYFVVEYRKRMGTFENSLQDSGLLVWRVRNGLNGNACGPPDELYLYRPGGTTTANGNLANAVFSIDVGRTTIDDTTDPSSFLSNGSAGGLLICGVGTRGGTISFNVGSSATSCTPNPSASKSSDPFSLKACLMDSSGNAVPGRVIHFDLAGIRYDAVTGPDGCAQVNNIYRCLASAVYPFVASWDGDTCYAASSGNQTLTISCDPTNITDDASKVHVVQYSDPITLGAWLKDEESLELTGKLLTFTVGTQSCADFTGPGGAAGCQPDNDLSGRNGYASCGITINQPASSPGCTPITSGIAFTGDGSYCASTKPITVTIEPEHATIKPLWKLPITCSGPNGDGVTMKLNAHVIEDSDGSYGDITKAGPLDFDVTDPTGASTTYSSNLVAVPNPNPGGPPTVGYGEVSFPQMVGIYCVNVRLHQGNCHYSASPVKVTTVVNCGYISPIVGGAPQELNLRPATEPLKDGTGQIVVDPETGKPVLKPTWKNYMYWGNTCNPTTVTVTYQWATLVKTHPARKSTCDVEWCPDPLQQNGDGIKTHWPLLYEVDGTTWTLTVAYWTNKPVRTNPSDLTMPPTRYHQETFTWKVARKDWSDLSQAVGFFRNMAAGKCELSMISNQSIADRIDWYVDGNPNPVPPLPPIKGIKGLISGGYNTEARARFGALESYLAGLCSSGCDAASGCCKEPAADVVKIVNTCDAPVVNTLINIIWAIQRANGYTD